MSQASAGGGSRQRVLLGTLIIIGLLTTIALLEVLGTVFLAMTVAYIFTPARQVLRRRDVGPVASTLLVTAGAVLGIAVIIAPLAMLLVLQLDDVIAVIDAIPETIELGMGVFVYELTLVDLLEPTKRWVRTTAISVSATLPVFLLKFALFGFVVFALVHNERDITTSVLGVVPPEYRDIGRALHRRARDTLTAIYVLQGATAVSTVVLALPVFLLFGYDSWFALAVLAGVLQFVPVIGPSVLIVGLVAAEFVMGELLRAILMLVAGGIVVAAAPDAVVRPRLAKRTTKLSSTLYFIGFVGGLLSLGAIGIIVGPLLVALLVEAAQLVSAGFADDETVPSPQGSGNR